MAKDLKFTISAGVERAEQEIRKLQATGQQVASILERDFEQLGARSTIAIETQRAATVAAYERIRTSGVATWQEVQTAHAAMTVKVAELDSRLDPVGAKLARIDQEIAGMMASGEAVVDRLSMSFEQLGIRSTAAIEKERAATVAAYEQIRNSGVATWQEIQTAHAAMTAKVQALDLEAKFGPGAAGAKTFRQHVDDISGAVDRLTPRFIGLIGTLGAFYVGAKIWEGFRYGIQAVDDFQQSVVKTAALITTLQPGGDIASNYQQAKQYAQGLNDVLMQIDSRTNLNLANLQDITEEMVKQGVVLDYTNQQQIDGFTNIANAVAAYSANGTKEAQLRQEIAALLRGEVNQNSQLASMLQRTVDGPLQKYVDQWKQSGTLVTEVGSRLKGFGPAADDLATSWGAVKSSLETSVSLVARAGFNDIVKDIAGWLGKINDYLKTHREEIGGKIKGAWEEAKALMSDAATIAKAIYNNIEPFAAVFVGGALLTGLAKTVALFTTLRDLAVATRAAMVWTGMLGAGAGAAGAAGTAAAAGGALAYTGTGIGAIGTGIWGTGMTAAGLGGALLPGAALGLGLGYMLQPAVRWADRKMYENFGINLTPEGMYNREQQKMADAEARWKFFQDEHANSPQNRAAALTAAPQLNLGLSPEQKKDKLDLLNKQLADYKSVAAQQTAYAKGQSEIVLEDWKNQYAQGKVSTADYYSYVEEVDKATGQRRVDEAKWVVEAQSAVFESAKKMFGADSKEALEESKKLTDAQKDLQSANFAYGKGVMASAEQRRSALKQEADGYSKLRSETLAAAGEYVAAEQEKQALDDKSLEYQRLKLAAVQGESAAVVALADVEKRRAVDLALAQQKQTEAMRTSRQEISKMGDQLRILNGEDSELVKKEAELRDGREELFTLQEKLNVATANGNQSEIAALNQKISLQAELNKRIQEDVKLSQRKKELAGEIVGYDGDTPIYADSYQKQQAANGYVSNSQLLNGAGPATGVNYWGEKIDSNGNVLNPFNMPSFDVGTPYVPYDMVAKIHKGERIITAADNAKGNYRSGDTYTFGNLQLILPNVTNQSTGAELARQAFPELMRLMNSRLKKAS